MAERLQRWRTFWRRNTRPPTEKTEAQALIHYLAGQVSTPARAASVLERVTQFQALSVADQEAALPGVYLLLEQYLAEVDPLKKYSRRQLRQMVENQYRPLLGQERFALIFEPARRQELLLCRILLLAILRRAYAVMGSSLEGVQQWLTAVPDKASLPLPFELDGRVPEQHREWIALMRQMSLAFYQRLLHKLGDQVASRLFESGYAETAQAYQGLETFPIVISILPESLLDEQKISLLSLRQIQRALLDNIDQLEDVNNELKAKNEELERTQAQLILAREEALRSSLQFRSVLNTMAEGVMTFDENGRIVLVNREVQSVWGYSARELVGQNLQCLLSPQSVATLQIDLNARGALHAFIETHLGETVELEGQRKDGRRFPVEMQIAETEIGGQVWYTAVVSDITGRKQAEQAMAHARDLAIQTSELKTRILASVSHDLRTPLNTVLGYADMLLEEVFGQMNGKQQEVLARILSSGKHMSQLITDLLDQTRLEEGQLVIKNAPFIPATMLQNTLAILTLAAREKGLELKSEIDPSLPGMLVGDAQRLQQVITNLTANAIKFTDRGMVRVRFSSPDERSWVIEIQDTGRGIPKTAYKRIFEPFQQLEEAPEPDSEKKQAGFGLGLYIVKELVTLMNGRISVMSEVGKGSTFSIWLPLILVLEEYAEYAGAGH